VFFAPGWRFSLRYKKTLRNFLLPSAVLRLDGDMIFLRSSSSACPFGQIPVKYHLVLIDVPYAYLIVIGIMSQD
jgi:hypothetical protein